MLGVFFKLQATSWWSITGAVWKTLFCINPFTAVKWSPIRVSSPMSVVYSWLIAWLINSPVEGWFYKEGFYLRGGREDNSNNFISGISNDLWNGSAPRIFFQEYYGSGKPVSQRVISCQGKKKSGYWVSFLISLFRGNNNVYMLIHFKLL